MGRGRLRRGEEHDAVEVLEVSCCHTSSVACVNSRVQLEFERRCFGGMLPIALPRRLQSLCGALREEEESLSHLLASNPGRGLAGLITLLPDPTAVPTAHPTAISTADPSLPSDQPLPDPSELAPRASHLNFIWGMNRIPITASWQQDPHPLQSLLAHELRCLKCGRSSVLHLTPSWAIPLSLPTGRDGAVVRQGATLQV